MKKILIFISTLALMANLVCNNITWSTSTTLSTAAQTGSDPQIATDANGNVIAVWVENGTIKSKTKLLNMSWSSTVTISGSTASSPRLVSDANGNAAAVWIENGVPKGATKPFGGSWTASTSLSTSGSTTPAIAVDSAGDVIAAWARNGGIETSTKLFGGAWQTRVIISGTASTLPSIAIGGSSASTRAVLAWNDTSSGTNVVYSSTKLISGAWSTKQIISDINHNAGYASVAVDANANATAVWYRYDVSNSNYSQVALQFASRPIATGVWSASSDISQPGIRNPALLFAKVGYDAFGNAVAVWNTSFDDATYNIESAVKPVGENWSEPVDFVLENLYASDFDVATSSFGDALTVYMFYNGVDLYLQSTEANFNGFMNNLWSLPINISVGTDYGFPHAAATVTGNAINAAAIWIHFDGVRNVVQAVTGSRSLVIPPSSLSVTQNSNNFGVFIEYYNTVNWSGSTDPNLAGYLIYRNGLLIGEAAASDTHFVDHNRVQSGAVTYGVAAINNQQVQSKIVTVNYP